MNNLLVRTAMSCLAVLGGLTWSTLAWGRCSAATLKGQYGFYRTGSTPAGPLAAVGFILFDGKGNTAGTQQISRNGAYTLDLDMAGPYTVDENCTGKLYTPTGVEIGRFVIVDAGREYYQLSLSNGNAVYGIGKKLKTED